MQAKLITTMHTTL